MGFGIGGGLGPFRMGVSTRGFGVGVGPLSAGSGWGGGGRRSGSGTAAATRRLEAAARRQAKEQQIAAIGEAWLAAMAVHRETFPTATRYIAPDPLPIDQAAILRRHEKLARSATKLFDRKGRRLALATAREQADAEAHAEHEARLAAQADQQAEYDRWWERLEACEPDAVLATLAHAFADNEASAIAVGLESTEVSLVVLVPDESVLPQQIPSETAAGNPSLKKATKTQLGDLYKMLVCGYIIATVREAFAVVPRLTAAHIVAVRATAKDAYGRQSLDLVMSGRCEASAFAGVEWHRVGAHEVFNDCFTDRHASFAPRTKALQPIPPADIESEIVDLVKTLNVGHFAPT